MAKIVYDESDSILIKNVLKLGLKSIESMNLMVDDNGLNDIERIKRIVNQMETIAEPLKESSSSNSVSNCKECD